MATEEPKFELLVKDGCFELRRYAPFITAETLVDGDMETASRTGFRLIADYIFGNNTNAGATGRGDAATTSTRIAMTVPVTMAATATDLSALSMTNQWRVHFVMPSQYSMETLPRPNNAAVQLHQLPARTFAVATYTGFNTQASIGKHTDALLAWLQSKALHPAGAPELARYNPPWTLPNRRRNEIHIEVKQR